MFHLIVVLYMNAGNIISLCSTYTL